MKKKRMAGRKAFVRRTKKPNRTRTGKLRSQTNLKAKPVRTARRSTARARKPSVKRQPSSYDQGFRVAYNEGYNTGFAKGFEDGHQAAYEQQA
ncbi:hypothetical protein [Cohnella sp. AR92]|uniref:hypothetical protein n=1 Tax=Cohnella sp. AR92 TaxID=648716 RepID=UPI000F8DD016|nr:hypothetical protein [Cohnella sp. AR92]RUS44643.1 hypothetical protein ELR57_22940 [Cohnella sp. AR92]